MTEISFVVGNEEQLDQTKELWEGLNQVHYEKTRDFKEHYLTNTFESRKADLLSKAEKGSLFIVLAQTENQKKVGYCIASLVDEIGEIESIYIQPEFRKLGIGDQLMQRSVDWVEERHPKKVVVTVSVGNEEVFGFYQKFGFYPRLTSLQMKKGT